jgi:predicted PurR-regulated permease PerM
MKFSHLNTLYFLSVLLVAFGVVLFLFAPFFTALLIAGVLATLFYPFYQWILVKFHNQSGWSAFLVCMVILLIVVLPLAGTIGLVSGEVRSLLSYASEHPEVIDQSAQYVQGLLQSIPFVGQNDITAMLKDGGQILMSALGKTYTGISQFFFWLFIMFFTLFYLLIDGKRAVRIFMALSPLKDEQERLLIKEFTSISRATLKGTVIIGVIQGMLGGILFGIVGVPGAITWGVVMIVLSIIPVLGSGLVWTPVGIGMILAGSLWQGVAILVFGFAVISTIDNILRPKLVGRDSQMHPLLVLLSTLGGIIAFGLIGFIIGPIIVALFMALLRIYEQEFVDDLVVYNSGKQ